LTIERRVECLGIEDRPRNLKLNLRRPMLTFGGLRGKGGF
jgi:hypothetical protein